MKDRKQILVVASHPDDEVLGCGGTMKRLAREGHDIHILILGEGITSRQSARDPKKVSKELNELHRDVAKAAKLVGAVSQEVLSFPDNRFDSVPLIEIIKSIELKKKAVQPSIIFTHHGYDLNIDHQRTFQAVMTACRPLSGETVKEIYTFEVPSSTEWQAQRDNTIFKPTFYVGLSRQQLEAKVRSMECYRSERRKFPHPRSPKALRSLAAWRGIQVGVEFAEAFEVIRKIV